jgi:hypothetical protein
MTGRSWWERRLLERLGSGGDYYDDLANDCVAYARDFMKKRWPSLERVLLDEGNQATVEACVAYATDVIGGRWLELETLLLDDPDCVDYLGDYMVRIASLVPPPWTSMEQMILQGIGRPSASILYATCVICDRWPPAESIILDANTPSHSPAFIHSVTEDDDEQLLCTTAYATKVIDGRWPDLEKKLGDGGCNSRVALEYAREVIGGELPELIHNMMVMKSFENPNDESVKGYMEFVATGRR